MATYAAPRSGSRTRRAAVRGGNPIAARLTPPGVPDWAVQRPRITTLIAEGVRCCPLTVVTGPVGAGKTMALTLWAATEPGPVAWVSLDEYHNRPAVFLSYVVAALRRSGVAVPRALPAARARAAENLFLLRLASALAAQNPPVTLVLDDFHVITEPRVLNGLEFLARNVGPGLRLVLSSRPDPPLPLHRYRLAGQLAEIRANDLAFSVAEAGLLLARHGCTLSAHSLEGLTRHTGGWAAGLRLAAISMGAHPDPDHFVDDDLLAEDSALTGFLVEEVLNAQPPEVRELLLSTCVLEQVNAEAATELAGDEEAGRILRALAHANAFVEPVGGGWYRYHTLLAQMLRRKLGRESPARIASLHRQAARWHQRNGRRTDAVRHAAHASDWQLAADIVIDGLAISEIIEPTGGPSPADALAGMPHDEAWTEPQPHLVSAALALSAGRLESAVAGLDAAQEILERRPADHETAARLAAAMIRLAVARRSGNLAAAAEAATHTEALAGKASVGGLARYPAIQARALSARGAVELWSGHLDEAVRVLDSGVVAAAIPGCEPARAACLGHLALAEALRGRLRRAAMLAEQAATTCAGEGQRPPVRHANPAALVALAWVHLEHHDLKQTRSRLQQLNAVLEASPDKLIAAIACLIAAYSALAEGRDDMAVQSVARARSGWQVPAWLEHELGLVESRASVATGKIRAAFADAEPASQHSSLEATVILAHARMAAGDGEDARRMLEPLLAAHDRVPDRVRLQACLLDARLSYRSGDWARGRRSLGRALRLAEREQLRLPFALDRSWIEPVLRRDPQLAHTYQRLLPPLSRDQLPAPPGPADQAVIPAPESLTEREREVLQRLSGMLTTAEIATELYISTNTVKSHVKNVCRKLSATHRGEAVRRARHLQLI
jgi:LuxR family maltose regulon positive regulatory protein